MNPLKILKTPVNSLEFIIFTSLLNTLIFNQPALQYIFSKVQGSHYEALLFTTTMAVIITSIVVIVLIPFYILNLYKAAIFIFLYFSAATWYFSEKFGIVYDSIVIESFFTTNFDEFSQYWNLKLAFFLTTLTGLMILLFFKIRLRKESFAVRLRMASKLLFACLVCVFAFVMIKYKDVSSFLRNHRHVRQMVVPLSPFYEFAKFLNALGHTQEVKLVEIGNDAKKMSSEKQIFVMVVGETARSDHFSFNNYTGNNTTPFLSKRNILTFQNLSSCGTSTAVSVPCLFSNFGRSQFSEEAAQNTENLLDVAMKADYETLWIDNNTGCKGVCIRTKNISLAEFRTPELCHGTSCFDEILVNALKSNINTKNNQFIVLHMLGSHGPSYYLRYPKEFEKFTPSCKTSDLSSCSQQEIINTYDNTILYTDYVLENLIKTLETVTATTKIKTSLLYVSDHGESLGENGIYLHSLPYFVAPDVQKKAAVVYWESNINRKYLILKKETLSHDFIFSSVLNILNIQTSLYKRELDFFMLDKI